VKLRLYVIFFTFFLSSTLWAKPERISVVIDNKYPPYSFIDENGSLMGISIDYWREWEKKTGVRVDITGTDWIDAQKRMEAGEFDVIDTMFNTEERSRKYDFSKPYARIDVVIFFDKGISGITDVKSLQGIGVGVKSGDADIDFLHKNGVEYLVEFKSYEDIIIAAKERRIRIFVIDKPPGIYFLLKHNLGDEFRYSEPLYYGEFHRAVKKGNKDLLSLIETGFDRMDESEKRSIEERWLGRDINGRNLNGYLKILLFAVITLSVMLAGIYVWVISLRRAVERRVEELRIEKERSERIARELIESEKRFANLYQNILDIIFTIRLDGKILDLNPKGLEQIGYSEKDLEKLYIQDIIPESEWPQLEEAIRKRLEGDNSPFVFTIISKKGERFIVETRGTILNKDGKPYAIQGIARDITLQKKMEEQLLESQKLESIGLLAGGIAHDFNNILMSIINYIEFIKKDYGNKDAFFSDIQHLRNSAERAAKLVQQLLGFSRKQMILPSPLDINELISRFANSVLKYLGENIKIELSLTSGRPYIYADKSQVEQMLMNLALNSRDAMPEGGRLTFSTEVVDLKDEAEGEKRFSGEYVLVSVSDTGCGIPEENLKKVFEPFFTTKPVGKGTGLGLSMVYGAMQQNKGFVRILSRLNAGTTVKLYFPLYKEAALKKEDKIRPQIGNTYLPEYSTILLVEDNAEVREVLKTILRRNNFNVIEASNFDEAVVQYNNNSDLIRLVICDIVMPDRSGVNLRDFINKNYGQVKFLFITGYSEEILKSKGVNLADCEILYKPFDSEKILMAINRLIEERKNPLEI
jgi:PAS domain S-box-containing protein